MATARPRRLRTALPVAFGALIASVGLVLGGIGTASARGGHGQPPPDASAPRHGGAIPNVTLVENQIKDYYGSVTETGTACGDPVVAGCVPGGTETLPSPESNYAREMHGIEARAIAYLRGRSNHDAVNGRQHESGTPALVFDIDDTLVNTYNYEIAQQFGYTPASNAVYVEAEAFPAVFGMPALLDWAAGHGYTIFFITGRPEAQRDATAGNLARDGYNVPAGPDRLFLKNKAAPPDYLSCGADCTTIQYKSGTRAHIEAMGYQIVGNFGDQYSDLKGGYAERTFKLPNPMYYLP